MHLSWNDGRVRAFAEEWRAAAYEKGETYSFYGAFFEVFAVRRSPPHRSPLRRACRGDEAGQPPGLIDLFWPGVLIVEQNGAGCDLAKACGQAGEYFDALSGCEHPRYILVSDFRTFELRVLDEREAVSFALADLPRHVEPVGFILGVQRRTFRDRDPDNIRAAELVGRLHDALADAGYWSHDLERFPLRIVSCLLADDTGIFEPRTSENGVSPCARGKFVGAAAPADDHA